MNKKYSLAVRGAGLLAGGIILGALAGCMSDDTYARRGDRGRHLGQTQATVVYMDDYDYYPGYEVYYSRNRREYVYRDGSNWVRRSEPRGITVDVLLAAPSVRVDFRDSPERHHSTVVKSYPRDWKKAEPKREDQRKNDKDSRKDDDRKDKKDRKDDDRKN
ncbi:MAG: hypothetical protein PSV13_02090 [Lacunisphaera sp.]|nr:hypothetical protein [Lacunisphaera sp.]